MNVVVDLNRCQAYAQCVFLAPRGVRAARRGGSVVRREVDADWKLGVRATGLDLLGKRVFSGDGTEVPFDRVLIATGTRARPSDAAGRAHSSAATATVCLL